MEELLLANFTERPVELALVVRFCFFFTVGPSGNPPWRRGSFGVLIVRGKGTVTGYASGRR